MSDQDKARRWHEVALGLALLLAAWEVFGLWGHHWLRRRSVEASVARADASVDAHLHRGQG